MSKTTVVLILFLFITIGISSYILLHPSSKNNTQLLQQTSEAQPVAHTDTVPLSMTTSTPFVLPGRTVTISVLIKDTKQNVHLTQLELGYNPTVLTILSIRPGTFFTNPVNSLQTIDPNTGRISYALSCLDATTCKTTSSQTIATITAIVASYANTKQTTITFLPKTLLRDNADKILKITTKPLTLTLQQTSIPQMPQASSSAGLQH